MTNKKTKSILRTVAATLAIAACVVLGCVMALYSASADVADDVPSVSSMRAAAPTATAMPKGAWTYVGSGRYTFRDVNNKDVQLPKSVDVDGVLYIPVLSNFSDTVYFSPVSYADGYASFALPDAVLLDLADRFRVTSDTLASNLPVNFHRVRVGSDLEVSTFSEIVVESSSFETGFTVKVRYSGSGASALADSALLLTPVPDFDKLPYPLLWDLYPASLTVRGSCEVNGTIDAVIRDSLPLASLSLNYLGSGSYGYPVSDLKSKVDALYAPKIAGYDASRWKIGSLYGGSFLGSSYLSGSLSLTDSAQSLYVSIPRESPESAYNSARNFFNNPFSVGAGTTAELTLSYVPESLHPVTVHYFDVASGAQKAVTLLTQWGETVDLSGLSYSDATHVVECYRFYNAYTGEVTYQKTLPVIKGTAELWVSYVDAPIGDYTVTFRYFDYTTFSWTETSISPRSGAAVVPPASLPLASERYIFRGWSELNVQGAPVYGSDELPAATKNATYIANYDVEPFNVAVSFRHPVTGETVTDSMAVPFGERFNYDPSIAHYAVSGWFFDAALTQRAEYPYVVTHDVTLYADFVRDKASFFPVRWHFNGEFFAETSVFTLDALALPELPQIPDGYVFSHYEQKINGVFLRIDALPTGITDAAEINVVYDYAQDYYAFAYADRDGKAQTSEHSYNVGTTPELPTDVSPYFLRWNVSTRVDGLNSHYTYVAEYRPKTLKVVENGAESTKELAYSLLADYGKDCRYCYVFSLSIAPDYGYYYCFWHEHPTFLDTQYATDIHYTGARFLETVVNGELMPVVFDYNADCSVTYSMHEIFTLSLTISVNGTVVETVELFSEYELRDGTKCYYSFNLSNFLEAHKFKKPGDVIFSDGMVFFNTRLNGRDIYEITYPDGTTPGDVSAALELTYNGNPKGFWSSVGGFFGSIGGSIGNVAGKLGNIFSSALGGVERFITGITSSSTAMWLTGGGVLLLVGGAVVLYLIFRRKKS